MRMIDSPLQNAMDDEVGISPNGRSEMRVFGEAKSEMPQGLGGITSLLQGTQHEVGDDAFFRFASHLSNQPLIMLWRDTQLQARKRHLHAAVAAVPVRVGPAGFRGRRDAAVANGDLALVGVCDAQRVTEGPR